VKSVQMAGESKRRSKRLFAAFVEDKGNPGAPTKDPRRRLRSVLGPEYLCRQYETVSNPSRSDLMGPAALSLSLRRSGYRRFQLRCWGVS
jgi:hypothetical protein